MARFDPPPNWPAPPAGWAPPPRWQPDPAWGPPADGWQVWVEDPVPALTLPAVGYGAPTAGPPSGTLPSSEFLPAEAADENSSASDRLLKVAGAIVVIVAIVVLPGKLFGGDDDSSAGAPSRAS